ncbi:MAG TPA: alpha/beta hydrolase [Actinomycetota bacterium]|nr:alpha/beta hydrolase [Actinomycetota bacterium]
MASHALTRDGISIAYDDRGVGDLALVCLPGWCSDRFQFSPVVDFLAERHRTIVVDWRGHGESDRPASDYGYGQMVEDVLAVVESAQVDRIVPVAASHAGWVALELRRRLGDRVAGCVFLSWMVLGAPPPFLAGLRRMQDADGWEEVKNQLFGMWRGAGNHAGVEAQLARMDSYGAETWMRAGREIESAYTRFGAPVDVLSSLDAPVKSLHVYAQPDDPAELEAQQNFASEHAWFSVRRLEAASHFPQFELPDETARLVEDFVSKL